MTNLSPHELQQLHARIRAKRARERKVVGRVFGAISVMIVAAGAAVKVAALQGQLEAGPTTDIVAAALVGGGVLLVLLLRLVIHFDDRTPLPPISQGTRIRRIGE